MLPSELDILTSIDRNGYLGAYVMHSTDFPSQYIVALFNSLRKRGFLSGNSWAGFRLTKKGRECVTKRRNGKNDGSKGKFSDLIY